MNTLSIQDIKPGMTVMIVDQMLNDHPACWVETPLESAAAELSGKAAMVVAVDLAKPGKTVALCFKEKVACGHTCDGRVPAGHGWYVLPEHVYTLEEHTAHQRTHDGVVEQQAQIDAMLKGFVSP